MIGLLSQAGSSITIQGAGEWIAALPETERNQIITEEPEVLKSWNERYGDRITELVFIGIDMNRSLIEQSLDDCLLTEKKWQKTGIHSLILFQLLLTLHNLK